MIQERVHFAGAVEEKPPPAPALLYVEHCAFSGAAARSPHFHAFWQLEVLLRGEARCVLADNEIPLPRGAVLLIAPGIRHSFEYPEDGVEYLSVKFNLDGVDPPPGPLCLDAAARVPALLGHLVDSLSGAQPASATGETDERVVLFRHTLAALLELVLRAGRPPASRSLEQHVRTLCAERRGGRITVEEIARGLSVSRSAFSKAFRAETGRSPKGLIDQERAAAAARLLRSGKLSISEVADHLQFPDLFGFSRFFKRMTGLSPREYRGGTVSGPRGG